MSGQSSLKKQSLVALLALIASVALLGCGSNEAEGWDSASRSAAENLAKNGNDINKISPEDRAALEKAAGGGEGRGMQSSTTGGAAATNSASNGATNGTR